MKSSYHIVVALVYVFVTIGFFMFTSVDIFSLDREDVFLFSVFFLASLLTLALANKLVHYGNYVFKKRSVSVLAVLPLYAFMLFALPEEIIFRYFVQGGLLGANVNTIAVILLSSAIYAFAHIFNGAKSLRPSGWNWKLVIMTATLGVFLGTLYQVTSNLLLPIILHGLYIIMDQMFLSKETSLVKSVG